MPTSKTWPGGATGASPATYSIPAAGELNWSTLSDFLIALADGAQSTVFQKFAVRVATTSPVTVSATTDCVVMTDLSVAGAVTVNLPAGANKQVFVIADGKGDAATNNVTINRAGSDTIAGGTSLVLNHDRESVILVFNSSDTDWKIAARSSFSTAGSITNADIAADAAIDFSKLADLPSANILVGSAGNVATATAVTGDISIDNAGVTAIGSGVIVNADVNASAAIAFSKLADLPSANILVGSAGNVATATAVTGDVTISNAGVTAIASGVIVNADVNASAAIDFSKLASLTSANILVGSAGNVATSTAVTGDVTISNAGVTAIASGVIVNADVNASAAIAGTKISPDFGSQAIVTTGDLTAGKSTLGQSSGQTTVNTIRAGTASNTPILDILQTSSGNASIRFNPFGGSDGGDFLIAGSGGYRWKDSSTNIILTLANSGLLTLTDGLAIDTGATNGNMVQGSYTPTLTSTGWSFSNVGAQYYRIGDRVTVWGYADATGTRTGPTVTITLPISSTFSGSGQVSRQQASGSIHFDTVSGGLIGTAGGTTMVTNGATAALPSGASGLRFSFSYVIV